MTGPRIDVDLCVLYVDTLKSSSILGAYDTRMGEPPILISMSHAALGMSL